jgi:hypothetical protein
VADLCVIIRCCSFRVLTGESSLFARGCEGMATVSTGCAMVLDRTIGWLGSNYSGGYT